MTDPTLTVTIWPRLTAPAEGRSLTLPWSALAERLRVPAPAGRERKTWAFATFRDNCRKRETHELSHALHLDFDCDPTLPLGDPKRGNPELEAADLQRALDGVRHFAHTTKRHAPGAARWRVIAPLSRSVDAADYGALSRVAAERFRRAAVAGLDADPSWCQPERCFFVPEAGTSYESYTTPPELPPLDVDEWLAEAEELDAQKAAQDWPEPSPLSPEHCAEPFPVSALPGRLGEIVAAMAESYQVPVDLPACVMLGLLAAAVAGKAVGVRNATHREVLVLWVCAVMRPGSRKSPVFSALRAPLDEAERGARAAFARERERAEAEAEDTGGEPAKSKPRKRKGEPEARPPVGVTADATPEALAVLMQGNGGRMLLASAEAVTFQHMTGLYQKGAGNLDVYLCGWSGDPLMVHRITRPPVDVPCPLLSVVLTVQPDVLAEIGEKRELTGRGVIQRFLWSVPRDLVGSRTVDAPEVPATIRTLWANTLGALLRLPVPASPAPVALDPAARVVYVDYAGEVEAALATGGALDRGDVAREWFAKAPGTAVRIAAVLAIAAAPYASTWVVDGPAMARGVLLMRYFGAHALHALADATPSPAERIARRLHGWLARTPERVTFTTRDAHLQVNTRGVDVRTVEAALDRLADAAVIRRVPPSPVAAGGRPPSPGWVVNPRWRRSS